MAKYYEKLGSMTPDNLIANTDIKTITGTGTVVSGAGVLERGTVMGTNSAGKLAVLGSTTGLTPYGILCDAVDASGADVVAEVYLTGKFKKSGLHVAASYTMTASDIKALRDGGIFIENAVEL